MKIKVMTFNLRTDTPVDGINKFTERVDRVKEVIANEAPDLIGFQEVADMTRKWLREALSDYIVVGCGRGKTLNDEAMVIAYKRSCFDMISMDTFWLSTAPSLPGSTYGVDQSSCPRCTTAVVLKHDDAEKPFLFLNTHLDHKGAQARTACKNACIGCKKCEKVCPHGAVTVQNNLATVDYGKCTGCGACAEACPTGSIKTVQFPDIPEDVNPRDLVR